MRTVLFYRNYRKFNGGTLKVFDYFNHVLASREFTPRIEFGPGSSWDHTNPWWGATEYVVDSGRFVYPDVFFVAGYNWLMLDHHPQSGSGIPVVNLVQHVRHADPSDGRFEFLSRRAIRICVGEEVAQALRDTGVTQGPLITIPIGLDLEKLPVSDGAERNVDVLISALKQPAIGSRLQRRLERSGRRVEVLSTLLPRSEYLGRIQQACTTVFLPNRTEGFYIPAIEGMALGTLVVCPDCVGNRSFCLPGHNSFRPDYKVAELARATESALALTPDQAKQMRANARQTAERHDLLRERRAFLDVLHDVYRLWRGTHTV
jgi:glycosyltransferase involved in cell wall biosynthesis